MRSDVRGPDVRDPAVEGAGFVLALCAATLLGGGAISVLYRWLFEALAGEATAVFHGVAAVAAVVLVGAIWVVTRTLEAR